MTSEEVKNKLESLGCSPEDYYDAESGVNVKKSGINKILSTLPAGFTIKSKVVGLMELSLAHAQGGFTGDAIYMSGYAWKPEKGRKLDYYGRKFYASATPENCDFSYRLEMCYNRLVAKIVLAEVGLVDNVYGEDEMNKATVKNRKKTTMEGTIEQLKKSS